MKKNNLNIVKIDKNKTLFNYEKKILSFHGDLTFHVVRNIEMQHNNICSFCLKLEFIGLKAIFIFLSTSLV